MTTATIKWGQGNSQVSCVQDVLAGCDTAVRYETVRRMSHSPAYQGRRAAQWPLRSVWRFLSRMAARLPSDWTLSVYRGGLSGRPDLWGGPVVGGYHLTVWAVCGGQIQFEIVISPTTTAQVGGRGRMTITLPSGVEIIVRDVATALKRIYAAGEGQNTYGPRSMAVGDVMVRNRS